MTLARPTALPLLALTLLLLWSGSHAWAQQATPPPTAEAMRLAFYAYDRTLPLHPKLKPLDETAARTRYALTYDSVHDQRVTAHLALPKGFKAPHPAIILVHGAGGDKAVDYIQFISERMTREGYATLSVDSQYHGERAIAGHKVGVYTPDSYRMRDAWVQTVIDLRRAVDYLLTRSDIAPDQIGYIGISQGGMLGATLGGVEERIKCFCLAVAGGGIVELVKVIEKYPLLRSKWQVTLTPDVLRRVEDIANVIDPIYFVGRIAPRPLLLITANKDEVIPPEASAALVQAAQAPPNAAQSVQVKRWESGHVLHPNAVFTLRDYFRAQFGQRARTAAR